MRQEKSSRKLFAEAWRFADQGNYMGALHRIEQAIHLEPTRPIFWAVKGQFLLDERRFEEAEDAARKSVHFDSTYHAGWALLGEILGLRRRSREAAKCLKRALELRDDFNYWTLLAAVQVEFDPKEAIVSAKRALAIQPDWDEAKKAIVEARKRLANID